MSRLFRQELEWFDLKKNFLFYIKEIVRLKILRQRKDMFV